MGRIQGFIGGQYHGVSAGIRHIQQRRCIVDNRDGVAYFCQVGRGAEAVACRIEQVAAVAIECAKRDAACAVAVTNLHGVVKNQGAAGGGTVLEAFAAVDLLHLPNVRTNSLTARTGIVNAYLVLIPEVNIAEYASCGI